MYEKRQGWLFKTLFFNICPFTTLKVCPKAYQIAKLGSKFRQILNKPSKDF